jgi:TPR repeat protein
MRVHAGILVSIGLLGASPPAIAQDGRENNVPPVLLCEDDDYSCGEVVDLESKALSGSEKEALSLYWYYLGRDERSEAMYWAQIAMENGSEVGRFNYASMLAERGDPRSLARAKFHLAEMAAQGDADAASLLRRIDSRVMPQR